MNYTVKKYPKIFLLHYIYSYLFINSFIYYLPTGHLGLTQMDRRKIYLADMPELDN